MKGLNFITIDFETATEKRDSPCEIGLTFVESGKIVETKSWLIRPINNEFKPYNIYIHGIAPSHVENSPEFDVLWQELNPLIDGGFLIAHNAAFDMSVLRRTLELYDIPFPTFDYLCSYMFSKQVWTGLSGYDLKTLCRNNGIEFNHHRAGDDSRATAELCLKAFEIVGASSLKKFAKELDINIGRVYKEGYSPCTMRRSYRSYDYNTDDCAEEIAIAIDLDDYRFNACDCAEEKTTVSTEREMVCDTGRHNPESIFYGKTVAVTGILHSMTRDEAFQKISDIGGVIVNSVSRKTDFLIVGTQELGIVGAEGTSTKQKKAAHLIEKGFAIRILSEQDFLKNL
jgi:DNA polymerase-3 subunit epsilon